MLKHVKVISFMETNGRHPESGCLHTVTESGTLSNAIAMHVSLSTRSQSEDDMDDDEIF